MQKKYFLSFLVCLIAGFVNAQGLLRGTVYESGTNNRMPDVFVRDNTNKQYTLTDKQGNFQIKTETGHVLIFDSPGYISDTLFVVDMVAKKIVLATQTIALREVSINSKREVFNPQKEYPDVYEKSKVYVLSPSSWFSKEGKDARRLKRYFKREAEERHIDAVFTPTYVGSIVPLKGRDLENFMTLYRPTYAFVMNNNGPSMAVYINDCYKKYQTLPPSQRAPQALSDTGRNK
jgi:hypothetical protein